MNTFFRMSQVNNMKKMAYALLAMHLLATNGLHAGPFKSIFARMNELEQQMSRLHEDLLKDFADISDDLLSDFALNQNDDKRTNSSQSKITHKAGHAITFDKNDDFVSLKLSGVDVDPERIDSYATYEAVDVTVPEANGTTRVKIDKLDSASSNHWTLWTVVTSAEQRLSTSKAVIKDTPAQVVTPINVSGAYTGTSNVTTPATQNTELTQEQYLKGEDLVADESRTAQQSGKEEASSKVDVVQDALAPETTESKITQNGTDHAPTQNFSSYLSESRSTIPGNFDLKNPEIEYNQTTKELVIKLMRVKEDPLAYDIIHKVAVKRVK